MSRPVTAGLSAPARRASPAGPITGHGQMLRAEFAGKGSDCFRIGGAGAHGPALGGETKGKGAAKTTGCSGNENTLHGRD